MYQEVCFNRGSKAGGGGKLIWATRSAPPSHFMLATGLLGTRLITGLPVRPSHKFGFQSSVSKNGHPGEGRHEGLVPRNDVLTNGFIWFSLARILARILFVPRLRSPWKTHKALRLTNMRILKCRSQPTIACVFRRCQSSYRNGPLRKQNFTSRVQKVMVCNLWISIRFVFLFFKVRRLWS